MASARISLPLHETAPAELDVVSLREPVTTESGILPRGAEGTVVMVWDGNGYCVEFDEPFEIVVNLRPEQVALLYRA